MNKQANLRSDVCRRLFRDMPDRRGGRPVFALVTPHPLLDPPPLLVGDEWPVAEKAEKDG